MFRVVCSGEGWICGNKAVRLFTMMAIEALKKVWSGHNGR